MGSATSTEQAILDRLDTLIALVSEIQLAAPRLSYAAKQAAAITGLSVSRVYQLAEIGRLAKVPNLGATILIPHDSLVALVRGES